MDIMIFPMQTSRVSDLKQQNEDMTIENDNDTDDKYPEMSQQYSNGSVVSDYESFFPLPRQNSTRVRTITQGRYCPVYQVWWLSYHLLHFRNCQHCLHSDHRLARLKVVGQKLLVILKATCLWRM